MSIEKLWTARISPIEEEPEAPAPESSHTSSHVTQGIQINHPLTNAQPEVLMDPAISTSHAPDPSRPLGT